MLENERLGRDWKTRGGEEVEKRKAENEARGRFKTSDERVERR